MTEITIQSAGPATSLQDGWRNADLMDRREMVRLLLEVTIKRATVRGRTFDHFFAARLVGAAAVEVGGGHMDVTMWRAGASEHVVRKH